MMYGLLASVQVVFCEIVPQLTGVGVKVAVAVLVGVLVEVAVWVTVAVFVVVLVGVAVLVDVGVAVTVGVLVSVGVLLGVKVGMFVGVFVAVLVDVGVNVSVGVGVFVGVAVGLSATKPLYNSGKSTAEVGVVGPCSGGAACAKAPKPIHTAAVTHPSTPTARTIFDRVTPRVAISSLS
jgi:hypothetical protein